MKMKSRVRLLCAILLISSLFPTNVLSVHSQPSVKPRVTRVVWGTNPDNPVKAYPGDKGVFLTVEVQNYSPNETIKGVTAVLMLKNSPFTDVYGNSNATATWKPVTGEVLNPMSFFTLTFSLNIDPNASPGAYSCNMTVNYSVKSSGTYPEGEPQTIIISLIVSKASSIISCSVSPTRIEKGETVNVAGSINPTRENATITLVYRKPDASTFNRTVQTRSDGSYRDSYRPTMEGSWSVNASWPGDEQYFGDWTSASFEVTFPVSLSVDVPDICLVGDREKTLNITISNSGGVLISTIDATLRVTSPPTSPSPPVIKGGSHWILNYLEPRNSTVIPVTIYAPRSAIGSTYSASLDLSYRDDYGQIHSETYSFGFIVKGWIELVVYEKTVSPRPVNPGSDVTITATILNRGNVAAMYTNVTVLSSPILDLLSESSTYVGEVDENSPVPFTVMARVKPDVEDGSYPVTVSISYRDDQHVDHILNVTLHLIVEKGHSDKTGQAGGGDLLGLILELRWMLLTLIGASLAILILYRRRLPARQTSKSAQASFVGEV